MQASGLQGSGANSTSLATVAASAGQTLAVPSSRERDRNTGNPKPQLQLTSSQNSTDAPYNPNAPRGTYVNMLV